MINPYKLTEGKKYAVIQGFVIDVKDRGDANMVLFKKDTHDPSSKLVAVAAWVMRLLMRLTSLAIEHIVQDFSLVMLNKIWKRLCQKQIMTLWQ